MRRGPLPASSLPRVAQKGVDDDAAEINIIANAPAIKVLKDNEIPTDSEFEILRLRRRVSELECTVHDRDDRIVKALTVLEYELQFWRTLLHDHIGETIGAILRRVTRLESSLEYLKQKGSRFYPGLDIPASWKKKQ